MPEIKELKITNLKNIYKETVAALYPHKEKPQGTITFIVEGTTEKPLVGIRYPGKKLFRRKLKKPNKNSALWANLYDFEVVPMDERFKTADFTYDAILKDFEQNKMKDKFFWKQIETLYCENNIINTPPDLPGIDSLLFLLMLKWIWIQEDFNYRLDWKEVNSPEKYILETRTGTRTGNGAGRAKFFAALILLKNYFSFEQVKKIIPLY